MRHGHVGDGTAAIGERDPVGLEEAPLHDEAGEVGEQNARGRARRRGRERDLALAGLGFGLGLG